MKITMNSPTITSIIPMVSYNPTLVIFNRYYNMALWNNVFKSSYLIYNHNRDCLMNGVIQKVFKLSNIDSKIFYKYDSLIYGQNVLDPVKEHYFKLLLAKQDPDVNIDSHFIFEEESLKYESVSIIKWRNLLEKLNLQKNEK